jgi:NAD+ synthase
VGTENKTEYILGYYTRFGDEASDIEPIRNLYKTQVYELAKTLRIPEEIIQKPPSADLWPEQTDEKEFGFTYKDADEIVYVLVDEKKSAKEAIASGYSQEIVQKIQQRMEQNAFKRNAPFHRGERTAC